MRKRNPLNFQSMERNHLLSHSIQTNVIRFFWIALIVWGELGVFFWSLSSCEWPVLETPLGTTAHVLLVSDAQVRHPLLSSGNHRWLGFLSEFFYDLNLKKNWHFSSRFKPQTVIFLGDMLANGKLAKTKAEYEQAVRKFKSIFSLNPSVPTYYIPGNNDIGMGLFKAYTENIRDFYLDGFGSFNQAFQIKGHTFLGLDAPGLIDEDYERSAEGLPYERWKPVASGTVSFIKHITSAESPPYIILSHIPLFRADTAPCGPLREKGNIRRGVGYGYQNTLGKQTTNFLLNNIQPSLIFSGDNRDYCEYVHVNMTVGRDSSNPIREITVKSLSMSVHIRKPGFQLLSLIEPSSRFSDTQETFAERLCTLPDQNGTYTLYFHSMLLTLIVIAALNLYRSRHSPKYPLGPISSITSSPIGASQHSTSALWSPTWLPDTPVSPRITLPAFRTPNTSAGPMFYAASRPTTPKGSPLILPMAYKNLRDDDYEDLEDKYPAQYTARREIHQLDEEQARERGLDSLGDELRNEDIVPLHSEFISAPGRLKPADNKGRWYWSWSFVAAGRRRRLTLSWQSCLNLIDLITGGNLDRMFARRTRIWERTLMDALNVLWPALIAWIIITWQTY